ERMPIASPFFRPRASRPAASSRTLWPTSFHVVVGQVPPRLACCARRPPEGGQARGQLGHALADGLPRRRGPGPAALGLLGRPIAAALDSVPEHLRQGVLGHGPLLPPMS